jgi:tagatose 1,6-diphosphate aldolase GatY/KbaY
MLISFAELLRDRPHGAAVGAFTAYDLEEAAAILHTLGAAGSDGIILIGSQSYAGRDGALLLAALVAAADRADARVCVQLDHCDDLGRIETALKAGAGAVMADAAQLEFEANVEFVGRAVELARRYGAGVEAELGAIVGDEDVARAVAAGALTDPAQAADFVARTGADCLAVSIGNVHGLYRAPPVLDWERLDAIEAVAGAPLSLHGASGIPDETVERAIGAGIAKVNVNTELRGAYLSATERAIAEVMEGSRLAALHSAQVEAVAEVVAAKLRVFEGRGVA